MMSLTAAVMLEGQAAAVDTEMGAVTLRPEAGFHIHLLLHDRDSWSELSAVTRLRYALSSRLLLGEAEEMATALAFDGNATIAILAAEVEGAVAALTERRLAVAAWRFDPDAVLVRGWRSCDGREAAQKLRRQVEAGLRAAALVAFLYLDDVEGHRIAGELVGCAGAVAAGVDRAAIGRLTALRRDLASRPAHG